MENQSPLNTNLNLSKIKTTIPLIQDGTMVKVRLADITESQRDGATIIKMEFRLVDGAASDDGGHVGAGFPLFVNFDTSLEFLQQKLARFIDGLLGTGDEGNKRGKAARPDLTPDLVPTLIGKEAVAKIIVSRSKKSDYVGNDIQGLTFLGDLAV